MSFRFALILWLASAGVVSSAWSAPHGTRVDEERIREAILSSWESLRVDGQTMEIEFAPPLLGAPSGEVQVHWPDPPISAGPRALTVAYEVGGRIVSRAIANVSVTQEVTVWILLHDVERGDDVAATDLYQATRTWDREPRRAMTDDLPGSGLVARKNLTAGAWLRHSDVRARPDVEAGQEIFLVARTGMAAVSIATKVRRGGSVGDTILVLNPLTGKVVRATLVSPNQAELSFANATTERKSP